MRRPDRALGPVILVLGATALAGCSSKPVVVDASTEGRNLIFIATAYIDAADGKLGRPPKGLEELKPFLKDMGNLDEILVSPNDGQPYVIVWGVKPGRYPIAYEQKGKDGKRMVVDARLMPWKVTDEEFARLKFPAGHKP